MEIKKLVNGAIEELNDYCSNEVFFRSNHIKAGKFHINESKISISNEGSCSVGYLCSFYYVYDSGRVLHMVRKHFDYKGSVNIPESVDDRNLFYSEVFRYIALAIGDYSITNIIRGMTPYVDYSVNSFNTLDGPKVTEIDMLELDKTKY